MRRLDDAESQRCILLSLLPFLRDCCYVVRIEILIFFLLHAVRYSVRRTKMFLSLEYLSFLDLIHIKSYNQIYVKKTTSYPLRIKSTKKRLCGLCVSDF